MKIRTQNLLITLPIFAALGLAAALLYRNVQQRELRWGLEERARGTVISLAAFLGDVLDEGQDAAARARLARVTTRGAELGLFTNIVVHAYRTDGLAEARYIWPEGSVAFMGAQEIRRMLGDEEFLLPPIREIGGMLCQPVLGKLGGTGEKCLGVAVPIPGFPGALQEIDRDAVLLFLFALFAGLLLVMWPSRFLVTGLKRLGFAGSGERDREVRRPLVREFADLDQAREAMVAIRDATVARARRGIVEHEQFRRKEDLEETLAGIGQEAEERASGSLVGMVRHLGVPQPGHFVKIFGHGDGLALCRGRVACDDSLAAGEQAIAVAALVPVLLEKTEPRDIGKRLAELFPVVDWGLVLVAADGGIVCRENGQESAVSCRLEPGQALVLASIPLEEGLEERLSRLSEREIFAVLQSCLGGRRAGMAAGLIRMAGGGKG